MWGAQSGAAQPAVSPASMQLSSMHNGRQWTTLQIEIPEALKSENPGGSFCCGCCALRLPRLLARIPHRVRIHAGAIKQSWRTGGYTCGGTFCCGGYTLRCPSVLAGCLAGALATSELHRQLVHLRQRDTASSCSGCSTFKSDTCLQAALRQFPAAAYVCACKCMQRDFTALLIREGAIQTPCEAPHLLLGLLGALGTFCLLAQPGFLCPVHLLSICERPPILTSRQASRM